MKVYFDGGWRPAPGSMETAVVVRGQSYLQRDLGPGSSMAAEWLALLHAVRVAQELGVRDPVFVGDSLAVIGQAREAVRCPPTLRDYLAEVQACGPIRLRHVKRSQNLAGIALARLHPR